MLREKIQHSVEVKMKQFAPPKGVLTVSESSAWPQGQAVGGLQSCEDLGQVRHLSLAEQTAALRPPAPKAWPPCLGGGRV